MNLSNSTNNYSCVIIWVHFVDSFCHGFLCKNARQNGLFDVIIHDGFHPSQKMLDPAGGQKQRAKGY